MLSKVIGDAHQGTQLRVHESIDAPIPLSTGLPSSPTLFDFPPPSIPESAKQWWLSDIANQSSALDDIYVPPHIISAMKECTDLINFVAETYRGFQQPSAPSTSTSTLTSTSTSSSSSFSSSSSSSSSSLSSASHWMEATKRFLDYTRKSKGRNDEWLSVDDMAEMLFMFQNDEDAAELFVIIADGSNGNEGFIRLWVQGELERLRETDSDWM